MEKYPSRALHRFDAEVVVLSAGDRKELLARGEQLLRMLASHQDLALADLAYTLTCPLPATAGARLGVVATSVPDLESKLTRALCQLVDPGCHRIEERSGVYYTDAPLYGPKALAFVFPGHGAQYVNMLADLAVVFREVRTGFNAMDRAFMEHGRAYLPSQAIFPPASGHPPVDPAALWAMDYGTAAVSMANQALWRLLSRLDIRPHAVLGHSAGVFCALEAADTMRVDETEVVWQVLQLNERFHRESRIPSGALVAVGAADREQVLALVQRSNGALLMAMDNCPHQVVLGGDAEAVAAAADELGRAGAICTALPFEHPYHTPALAEFSDRLHELSAQIEFRSPTIPLYSCVTATRCPNEPAAVRRLVADQWSQPVRFRETIEAMHADGLRIFVEVGPRGNLAACIDDTLRGRTYLAAPANVANRSGVTQLAHLVALLAAHHVPMNLEPLYLHRSPRRLRLDATDPVSGVVFREQIMRAYVDTMDRFLDVQQQTMQALLDRVLPPPRFPLLGTVVSLTKGQELVAVRRLDVTEDLFLHDHTFGRHVSATDESLLALPVVPFTISMEMLAEAASALLPGRVVIGMNNVRVSQWIALDDEHVKLRVIARRDTTGDSREVRVELQRLGDDASGAEAGTRVAEGIVTLADDYPAPPPANVLTLGGERPYAQGTTNLYAERMFHGPRFQGVVSLDRWGEDGTEATLITLPTVDWFTSTSAPTLVTDPQLLDAAAQLAGFWAAEHRSDSVAAFPFALDELQLYEPTPPAGTRVTARARIALPGKQQIRSDIDLVRADGSLRARVIGLTYRCFDLPKPLARRVMISPHDATLGRPWPPVRERLPDPTAFVCCRVDELTPDLLTAHGQIWQRALAHLALSRRERAVWATLAGSDRRRSEWLLRRVAAKDAVRVFLRAADGLELCPADVEIFPDEHGKPVIAGAWTPQVKRVPAVSLSHCDGVSVAIAGHDGRCKGIGIELERVDRVDDALHRLDFRPQEQRLVGALDTTLRQEWALRLWCAKEAASKALGRGLEHLTSLVAVNLDLATGVVQVVAGSPRADALVVHTVRDGDWVAAVTTR